MSDQKKRAHIISSFRDDGTGETFTAGDTPLIEPGAYANYEAAGLVGAPPVKAAAKPTPATKPKATSKRVAKAKPAGPKSAPVSDPTPAPVPVPEPVDPVTDGDA